MNEVKNGKLYKQNTDLEIIGLFFPYLTHQSFLDIGAENGEFTRYFSEHGLKGTFFEPLPKCADDLSKLATDTGCTFSTYAIDTEDRTADFYHAFDKSDNDAQYFSSLHPLQNDNRIQHKKVCTVQCRSLNSLLKEGLIDSSLGVIKIDTEGNDLNVLKGMTDVKSEVLMCEYFMPNIYAGWELGHPIGLINEAKKLGFNHYISIKRIDDLEFVSLDNDCFIDKQWGNLIFISDEIYKKSIHVINHYVNNCERLAINTVLNKFNDLYKTCDERLNLINLLQKACDERNEIINNQTIEISTLKKLAGGAILATERLSNFKTYIKILIKKSFFYKLFRT